MHGQVPASRKGSVLRFIVGTFVLLLVLAVCGGLIWFNFFRDKMIAQFFAHFPVPTITVSTVEVSPQKWTPGIDAVGTLAAAQGVEVAGQVGGVVKAVNFKGNDKVAAGAVLVQIDDSVELAGLTAAESTVAVNQDALDRTQMLFTRKVATSADLQTAQNKLALAQGVTEQIHARVAQRAIVAPFAGVTGIPKVVVGQYIEAGKPVATLQDLSRMRVDFTIPEQQLADLWIDEPVSIGLSEGHLDYKGTITGIDPKIDPQSRLVAIRAVVDNANGELRPGQFARVRAHLHEEPSVIALPQTAVVMSLYGNYVYQVIEALPPPPPPAGQPAAGQAAAAPGAPATPAGPQFIAKQIFVETGRRSDTQIEVVKGVTPGMQIVSSGQNKLSNGSHVTVDNSVNPGNATTADASK